MLLEWAVSHGKSVNQAEVGPVTTNTDQRAVPLTVEEFRELWSHLAEGSRTVLAEVATRPQGYPVAELRTQLDVNGPQLGGMLSSLGVAITHLPGMQDPLERDWIAGEYRLSPEIAAVIREME
jgi:hypothetical protein